MEDATRHVEMLEKEVKHLKEKMDDLVNGSRRNNIRLLNLPERAEGRDELVLLTESHQQSSHR